MRCSSILIDKENDYEKVKIQNILQEPNKKRWAFITTTKCLRIKPVRSVVLPNLPNLRRRVYQSVCGMEGYRHQRIFKCGTGSQNIPKD